MFNHLEIRLIAPNFFSGTMLRVLTRSLPSLPPTLTAPLSARFGTEPSPAFSSTASTASTPSSTPDYSPAEAEGGVENTDKVGGEKMGDQPRRFEAPATKRRRTRYRARMKERQRQRVLGHRERKANTAAKARSAASKADIRHELDASFHRFLAASAMMEYAPGGASVTVRKAAAKRKAKSDRVERHEDAPRFRLSLAEEKLYFAGDDGSLK